jgi:hypothetical protein
MSGAGPVITPAAQSNFTDACDAISPTYLNGPVFQKYRASMNFVVDALADGAAFAVRARFPSTAPTDAFVWLSLDRTISQGFQEGLPSYIQRLQQWLPVLSYEGHPTGMLLAMLADVLPTSVQVRTVDNSGNWFTYAVNANPIPLPAPSAVQASYPAGYPAGFVNVPAPTASLALGNWRWDSLSQPYAYGKRWWRLWPIMYSPGSAPFAAPSATWAPNTGTITVGVTGASGGHPSFYSGTGGSGSSGTQFNWDDGTCWDWAGTSKALSRAESSAITSIATQWKAANVWVVYMIVSYDSTMFDPAQAFGSAKLPDGTWGSWAKVTAATAPGATGVPAFYAASRPASTTASFLMGSGEAGVGGQWAGNGRVYSQQTTTPNVS